MRLRIQEGSHVYVDVQSKALIAALDHEMTFTAALEPTTLPEVSESGAIEIAIDARVPVARLEPPAKGSSFDRDKMIDNLRGRDVLDVKKWPSLEFRGRYRGTLEKGELDGELVVRGTPRRMTFAVDMVRGGDGYEARAMWEGTQTALGMKPYKALLGALRLTDFLRIRIELTLVEEKSG